MESQGELTVVRMCGLAQISRAGFYRHWEAQEPRQEEMELREAIQQDWIAHRPNGYRSVTRRLHRLGWVVNAKRVQRLMREDNLLGLRKRKFVVTSDSEHDFLVYPNLAKQLVLTASNQLWVADITYVRLQEEFVYLAVVLDAYSRRVVGWALRRTLSREVALAALDQALANRQPGAGLVHHSDRGSQYASNEYVARLEGRGALMSMSGAGRPWENGKCERFIGTAETGATRWTAVSEFGRVAARLGEVSGNGLQSGAMAFGVGLSDAGGVRAATGRRHRDSCRWEFGGGEFSEA